MTCKNPSRSSSPRTPNGVSFVSPVVLHSPAKKARRWCSGPGFGTLSSAAATVAIPTSSANAIQVRFMESHPFAHTPSRIAPPRHPDWPARPTLGSTNADPHRGGRAPGPLRPSAPVSRRLLAAALLLSAAPALAREKTDVVVLLNGDHLTGEIKGMTRGKLDFNTDDAGRLSIEWDKVLRMTSAFSYEVDLSSGQRFYGVLATPTDRELAVGLLPAGHVVAMSDVVEIVPMDDSFFGRVRAVFDLGFTLAKANSATTLSASGEVAYRAQWFGSKLAFDAYFQDDDSNASVSRYSVMLQGDVYFEKLWRAFLGLGVDHNDQLDLILRVSISAGPAYSVVRNGWTELWLSAGLVGSQEQYTARDATLTLDGLVGASWDAFRYDSPKLDMTTQLVFFPGLSDWGRLRGTFSFHIRYEVIKDFNVGLVFQDTFDTRPPDPNASKNDYIAQLTIGWSYRR